MCVIIDVLATDKQYTGQQQEPGDAALGLYNYKARFYSTVLGRFVSADTVADGLNRYEYVRSSPMVSVDPSGRYLLVVSGSGATCARWYCSSYDQHLLAYWTETKGYSTEVAGWLLRALKGSWPTMGELERVRLFDVAFDDPSEFTHNKDEQSSIDGMYNHVQWLNTAAPDPLTYAFGTSYGGLVLHDFIVASRTGALPSDLTNSLAGVIISAAPTHKMAALYGVDLFPNGGHAVVDFPIVTRSGASQASWLGHIADLFHYDTSLTVDGALNLQGTDDQHSSDGASTIWNDFQYIKMMREGEPVR